MSACVFCRIVAKKIPAAVVYEDELTLAFMDAGQVNPGHVLVAAKGHVENVYELDDAQAGAFFDDLRARLERGSAPAIALHDARVAWLATHPAAAWVRSLMVFQ